MSSVTAKNTGGVGEEDFTSNKRHFTGNSILVAATSSNKYFGGSNLVHALWHVILFYLIAWL